MRFDHYQREVVRFSGASDTDHEIVPMLGLGGHVGAILLAHQRYLRDQAVVETRKVAIGRELGLILRWSALLAHAKQISFDSIAYSNLRKIAKRAQNLGLVDVLDIPTRSAALGMTEYSRLAAQTDQEIKTGFDPLSLSVPMLGLIGEVGSLLVEEKKRYRKDSEIDDWQDFVQIELGDLLWYTTTVARHVGTSLEEIARADLVRAERSSSLISKTAHQPYSLDETFPETERFPRQLHLHFEQRVHQDAAFVTMTLRAAEPNVFPGGPIDRGSGKYQGFSIGEPLGDEVDDNSRRVDAYRYHDAIHLGFLAVLGWSPNLRSLLHLKRKSDPVVDTAEDGARAIFAEEGMAAILAKQATLSRQFETPKLVPEELLDLIALVVEDLEVSALSYQMWRSAISQGFTVMQQLNDAGGGHVLADLDARTLSYSKFPFPITT